MANWLKLRNAKKNPNNECYTLIETINEIIPHLDKSKKYIMCCKDEDKLFYKTLLDNGFKVRANNEWDMWKIKEYIAEDEIIITNPPFHGVEKWIRFLIDNNLKYWLIVPWTVVYDYKYKKIWQTKPYCEAIKTNIKLKNNKFLFIKTNEIKHVGVHLISNI